MWITGINHVTFAVQNLEVSFAFYRDVLGLQPVVKWREGAYFAAGEHWIALAQDDQAGRSAREDYSHIAFSVSDADFAAASHRILNSCAKQWQENTSQGASLYFLDPDGHKLELHVSDLAARLHAARDSGGWRDAIFY